MSFKKRILVCPLNWGLGHSTRCIPIINKLINEENSTVVIGASGRSLALLKQEFPSLEFVEFEDYNITYHKNGSLALHAISLIPRILYGIYKEHQTLKKIIREKYINEVISDNRFGLWNRSLRTIYITHQVMIKIPTPFGFVEPILYKIHSFFIKRFNECWIPDFAGENNLSGDLSHKYPVPVNGQFIKPQSRFVKPAQLPGISIDLLIIISGPEPQRTLFETMIFEQIKEVKLNIVIVLGKPEEKENYQFTESTRVYSHLKKDELLAILLASDVVLCRSGYSTIMDLVALDKKAIFIPTPGQTEQEYLAEYLGERANYIYGSQTDFDLLTYYHQLKSKLISL